MSHLVPSRHWPARSEIAWIVAFWGALGLLAVVQEAVEPLRASPLGVAEVGVAIGEYVLWALATPVVLWFVSRYPAARGAWAARLAAQAVGAAALAILVEYVTRGVLRPLTGPVRPGWEWSLDAAVGGLWFLDELVIALAILATGYARSAAAQARQRQAEAERASAEAARNAAERDRAIAERERLAAQLSEARLSTLRAQLHPHFLFNTLHTVNTLVERDPAGARTVVTRLSMLLRRVLESGDSQVVPLREEAAFVRDYLDVQAIRHRGRLEVEEAWGPGTMDALVPPLVLQPLVENAVVHGIARIEEGMGRVRVASRVEGDGDDSRLVLTVEDDGPGLDGEPERPGGVGVPNTRDRLDALYGTAGRLSVEPREGGGVRATVVLPYRRPSP